MRLIVYLSKFIMSSVSNSYGCFLMNINPCNKKIFSICCNLYISYSLFIIKTLAITFYLDVLPAKIQIRKELLC